MPVEVTKRWANNHAAETEKSVALPAAGATATTDAIDLGADRFEAENAEVEIHIDATAAAAGKKITLTPEHSSDGLTFTAAPLPGMVLTGGAAGGTGEFTTRQFCPAPADALRYLRLSIAVETGAGDLTGGAAWIALVPQPSMVL